MRQTGREALVKRRVRFLEHAIEASCVHVTAISSCGTECAYAESVDRSGLGAKDIGEAVINAVQGLAERMGNVGQDIDGATIMVRFSQDT